MTYHLRTESPDGVTEQDYETLSDALRAIWRPLWKEAGRSVAGSQHHAGLVHAEMGTPRSYGIYTHTLTEH